MFHSSRTSSIAVTVTMNNLPLISQAPFGKLCRGSALIPLRAIHATRIKRNILHLLTPERGAS